VKYWTLPSGLLYRTVYTVLAKSADWGELSGHTTLTSKLFGMDLLHSLLDAIVMGEEALVETYLNLGANINMTTSEGYTVLHWAAASSEGEKLVPFLIGKGIALNLQDNNGYTPLHLHALRGRIYGVSCLLHSGASPNITTTEHHYTPLHLAVMHNQTEVVSILLSFGADSSLEPLARLDEREKEKEKQKAVV
jgi:ankyrin repeat protein